MSLDEVMPCTKAELYEIRTFFGKTTSDLKEDVKILRDWIKQEPHLPKEQSEQLLETMLILNKFSLERTKKKLEMYYTARSLFPEMFEDRAPTSPHMRTFLDTFMILPLPVLTQDHCRITVFTHITGDASKLVPMDFVKYTFTYCDLRVHFDHYLNDYIIVDMRKSNLEHVKLVTPTIVRDTVFVFEKAFSDRLKGIHYINCSPATQAIVRIIKSMMKKKLSNRVHVHKHLDSLHDCFSKECLPSDYVGNLASLDALNAKWRQFLEEQEAWIVKAGLTKTNEKLRIGEPASLDLFGLNGSFKQLQID